jgi:hypothetical protein
MLFFRLQLNDLLSMPLEDGQQGVRHTCVAVGALEDRPSVLNHNAKPASLDDEQQFFRGHLLSSKKLPMMPDALIRGPRTDFPSGRWRHAVLPIKGLWTSFKAFCLGGSERITG